MKVSQLFESDPLQELEKQMLLRSTKSRISQEQAEEVLAYLDKERIEWELIEKVSAGSKVRLLKIPETSIKGGHRGATGYWNRRRIQGRLEDLGFETSCQLKDAVRFQGGVADGPHIYFW